MVKEDPIKLKKKKNLERSKSNKTPRNGFKFSFWACSDFLFGGLRIELKFYLLKDLFLKIEGSRIVLN